MSHTFIIPGVPIPQHRPRFTTRGGFGRAYSCESDVIFRRIIQAAFFKAKDKFASELGSSPFPFPKEIPLAVHIDFLLPVPDSYSTKKRNSALEGVFPHIKKPDVDNLIKGIFDGLKGLAWYDDCQVVQLSSTKRYGQQPMTIMTIAKYPIKEPQNTLPNTK